MPDTSLGCKYVCKFVGRLFNVRGPEGALNRRGAGVKKRGVYSHNCNKLNKTHMLSAKISREFKNGGKSTRLVDTSRPSRDPRLCQNPRPLLCCHC